MHDSDDGKTGTTRGGGGGSGWDGLWGDGARVATYRSA